jgi:hypothetical protein
MVAKITMRIADFEGNYIERLVSRAEFCRISEYLMFRAVSCAAETKIVTAFAMQKEQRARAKLARAFAKAKKEG